MSKKNIVGLVGTVTVTKDSAAIVGSGTDWDSTIEGKYIRIGTNPKWYTIYEVTDTTHLSLTQRYREPTASGQQFDIGENALFERPIIVQETPSRKDSSGFKKFSDFDESF